MCYSANCPYELWSGECGRRRNQVCPESYESEEEYEQARQKAQDYEEEKADYLYECEKDRRMGL